MTQDARDQIYPGLTVVDGEIRIEGTETPLAAVISVALKNGPGQAAFNFGLSDDQLTTAMSATFELLMASDDLAEVVLAIAAGQRAGIQSLLMDPSADATLADETLTASLKAAAAKR